MRTLSKRLQAVTDFVRSQGVIADIGCDHGYTSIFLVENSETRQAIATDIGAEPLKHARHHIREAGLEGRIQLRLGDGLKPIHPGEVDAIVITGMGGALMSNILSHSQETALISKELILSPQSEPGLVRKKLHEMHICIDQEKMLKELGKYYVIFHALPCADSCQEREYRQEEYRFGSYLLEHKDPVLWQYLEKEKRRVNGIRCALEQQNKKEKAWQRYKELVQEEAEIDWALARYVR